MRVFVLCTGRCGSTTFAEACRHLDNFTSAHQSNAEAKLFEERFAYPDRHIEVDNRLSWFLGGLAARYDDADTFYVHLTRDPEEVARSYNARWRLTQGIIPAFAQGILLTQRDWTEEERIDVCRFFVETVNANIREFLGSRRATSMSIALESIDEDFDEFLGRIVATGDLNAARGEWMTKHNATAR